MSAPTYPRGGTNEYVKEYDRSVKHKANLQELEIGYLRAKVAEQEAEIERLKTTPADKREDLRCVIHDLCEESRELREQLTAAQAQIEQLREALVNHQEMTRPIEQTQKALSIPTDFDDLREHDARLVEKVFALWFSGEEDLGAAQIVDQIRKGEF